MTGALIILAGLLLAAWITGRWWWRSKHGAGWKDRRAALRSLDLRNGWIVERGRDKRIFHLHCLHCGAVKRGVDMTSGGVITDRLIDCVTAMPCDHRKERQ